MRGKKEEKFYQKKAFWWSIFIVVIMTSSTIGYLWTGNQKEQNRVEYNGFTFYRSQGFWFTRINDQQYNFQYLPEDVLNISSTGTLGIGEKIYLAYDPSETELNTRYPFSILSELLRDKGVRPVYACIAEENCPDIPIVDCNETDAPIVLFIKGEESRMYNEEQCLIVEIKDNQDVVRVTEKMMYDLLGVIR